ncbi:hypothetical protein BXO88_15115 [Oribacterium sp. C9]|uniref:hypothetical protein n=1 Tax=Oribacterium sp. C9 TaxID=1943579 RepID=UPI0003DF4517|nr:hypothetical protein [Oribacterium sp. C9]ETP71038.1 hypothetical protein UYO_3016 [Lachnospiraceae bacterium JC7]OON84902.1 hypothetical protein BXO88_15115 [Oribacterium sp. C9]
MVIDETKIYKSNVDGKHAAVINEEDEMITLITGMAHIFTVTAKELKSAFTPTHNTFSLENMDLWQLQVLDR